MHNTKHELLKLLLFKLINICGTMSHVQVGNEVGVSSQGSCSIRCRLDALRSSCHLCGWGHRQSAYSMTVTCFLLLLRIRRPLVLMIQDLLSLLSSPWSSSSRYISTGQANRRATTSSTDMRRDATVKHFLTSLVCSARVSDLPMNMDCLHSRS